jgi:hypothetical protein
LCLVRAFKGIGWQFEALAKAVYQPAKICWIRAQKRRRNDDGAVVKDHADILGAIKYRQPL